MSALLEDRKEWHRVLVREGAWVMATAVLSRVAGLVAGVFVARYLGVAEFGVFSVIQVTAVTAAGVLSFAFGTVGSAAVAAAISGPAGERRSAACTTLAGAMAVSTVIAVAGAVGSPVLSSWLGVGSGEKAAWILGALLFEASALWAVTQGLLIGLGRAAATTKTNVLYGVLVLGATAALVPRFRVAGAIGAMLLANLAGLALNAFVLAKSLGLHKVQARELWGMDRGLLWNGSVPAALTALATAPVGWWALSVIARAPGGVAEVATFNAANQWRTAAVFVPQTLGAVWVRLFASRRGDAHELRRRERDAFAMTGLFGLGVGALMLGGATVVEGVYGSGFVGVASVVRLLAIAVCGQAVAGVAGNALVGRRRLWHTLALNVGWACAVIAAVSVWGGEGAVGLARSHALAYSALSVASMVVLARCWPARVSAVEVRTDEQGARESQSPKC
jgi:O-antigen/teichoic acid export membrane protein